jgi:hypothetical protein
MHRDCVDIEREILLLSPAAAGVSMATAMARTSCIDPSGELRRTSTTTTTTSRMMMAWW